MCTLITLGLVLLGSLCLSIVVVVLLVLRPIRFVVRLLGCFCFVFT